ncbi:MAG: hypothetical protein ACO3JG_05960 [Luteolibacter sp.]
MLRFDLPPDAARENPADPTAGVIAATDAGEAMLHAKLEAVPPKPEPGIILAKTGCADRLAAFQAFSS